ncbi:MAG TPA: N,N-dimethylformamidase beta subunit family domain-containing protein, partial [Thermoanaerobaculia bacterium]|nr:N,N-dimethylformamidase beta subunit family domain-containing protein [Thermoanaerobaculia bacterium]
MSSRRQPVLFAVAMLTLLAISTPADAQRRRSVAPSPTQVDAIHAEGGYADLTSVEQGGAIRFHIATKLSPFSVSIVNLSNPNVVLRQITGLQSRAQSCTASFTTGCGWNLTTTVDIPAFWPSGYYAASFPTSLGARNILFVVRPAQPGSTSKILVVSPTNTYQAFNTYGGASLNPPTSGNRAASLSFDRPYDQAAGLGRFESWERKLVDWMSATGRAYEVVTDHDLHDPTLLSNYNVVVLVGHSAYWTAMARQHLETFNSNGGHIAILGGNTMWFRVALQDDGRTLVGQSDAQADFMSEPNGIITANWYRHPVNQPENRIVATSYRHGGHANRASVPDRYEMIAIERRTPWTVTDSNHWVFNGTGLVRGATFGHETTGLEVDGVVYNCDISGNAVGPDGSDEAPLNYHILAVTPASLGWGTMGYYVNAAGGAVFNAASQGWVWGLEFDDVVQRITANVLDRFVSGTPLQYDPVQTSIVAQDLFNCPQTLIAQSGWRTNGARGAVTSGCA